MSQSLYQRLQACTSEEDVKDEYIRALGLKGVSRNLIDIQTKEIWFEAKDGTKESIYAMFTQLLHYVQQALNEGEYVPPFLCVIDCAKAAIMRTEEVLPFLAQKTIKWGKSASNYTQEALDAVSGFIGTHFVAFRIETHEEEFIQTVKNAIKTGQIIRTQITPGNLKSVFDKWVLMIGLIQSHEKRDLRYDGLVASIIQDDGSLPKNVSILSWNYDYQIEYVLQDFSPVKSSILHVWQNQGVTCKGFRSFIDNSRFNCVKLNGTAMFSFTSGNELIDPNIYDLPTIEKWYSDDFDRYKSSILAFEETYAKPMIGKRLVRAIKAI